MNANISRKSSEWEYLGGKYQANTIIFLNRLLTNKAHKNNVSGTETPNKKPQYTCAEL